mmetsp:Transcript_51356/g.92554  ORF Transcript_51356/g.92554 Transcript_51356/m.92554 type:complete len:246 (+) Transcript_51356:63-800(+)
MMQPLDVAKSSDSPRLRSQHKTGLFGLARPGGLIALAVVACIFIFHTANSTAAQTSPAVPAPPAFSAGAPQLQSSSLLAIKNGVVLSKEGKAKAKRVMNEERKFLAKEEGHLQKENKQLDEIKKLEKKEEKLIKEEEKRKKKGDLKGLHELEKKEKKLEEQEAKIADKAATAGRRAAKDELEEQRAAATWKSLEGAKQPNFMKKQAEVDHRHNKAMHTIDKLKKKFQSVAKKQEELSRRQKAVLS